MTINKTLIALAMGLALAACSKQEAAADAATDAAATATEAQAAADAAAAAGTASPGGKAFAAWLGTSDVLGVLVRSGKDNAFCAGADLTELGVAYDMIVAAPARERFTIALSTAFFSTLRSFFTSSAPSPGDMSPFWRLRSFMSLNMRFFSRTSAMENRSR